MTITRDVIEFIFSVALFLNAILFIPQALRILKEKSAKNVSLTTFLGFLLIQLAVILHAAITNDYLLMGGYILSVLACGSVVLLIIYYGKNKTSFANEITLEEIVAQLPEHVYWKDKNGVFVGGNINNWKDMGLKSATDFIGKTDYDVLSEKEADKIRIIDQEVMKSGQLKITEEIVTSADGKKTFYLSSKAPLKNSNHQIIGVIGTSVDITQAQQETENKLDFLENIIAVMPGHVYWLDKDGVYLGCNNNSAKTVGLNSRKEIIGKRNIDIPGFVIPDKIDAVNKQVVAQGKTIITEEPAMLPDGTEGTFLSSKVPIFNNNKEVIGLVGISIDITQQRQAEVREREALAEAATAKEHAKAETELRQAIMVLAGSIAHDMRTPLTIIRMLGEVIGKVTPSLVETYQLAQQANLPNIPDINPRQFQKLPDVSNNLGNIVTEMNDYINVTLKSLSQVLTKDLKPEDLEYCSADYCINKAISSYPFEADERELLYIDSMYQFEFMGNQILLFRVFSNLIKNSLYQIHHKNKGEIFISTRDDGEDNQILIKDTAGGASPDIVENLFDGYKTTKKQGTGVGLAFCKLTMESFQGSISCHSVEGDYIEFVLSFPKLDGKKNSNL